MPTLIYDVKGKQAFPVSLKTLMHLGVKKLNIFEDDKLDQDMDASYEVIGMPAMPALYSLLIKNFKTNIETLGILQRYYLIKGTKCESFLHFLLNKNEDKFVK